MEQLQDLLAQTPQSGEIAAVTTTVSGQSAPQRRAKPCSDLPIPLGHELAELGQEIL